MSGSTTGSDWSESGTAVEVRAMVDEWTQEGKRGTLLMYAVQEMITEDFLNTMSPRSCKLLRRFLVLQDVAIDVRLGYPHYRALQDLIKTNHTLVTPSAPEVSSAVGPVVSEPVVVPAGQDTTEEISSAQYAIVENGTLKERDTVEIQATVPVESAYGASPLTAGAQALGPAGRTVTGDSKAIRDSQGHQLRTEHERYPTRGPSRSVVDLVKAYSSDRGKFSGEDAEQSLRLVRRSFFSACSLMHVNTSEALTASYLPFVASALEYYYEVVEERATRPEQVFDMIRDRFQTRTVQDRALSQWQTVDFASQKSDSDASDHDTLQSLYFKGKRIHRSLPKAYSDDIHLRDFLLRACAAEPFSSKIPDEPAKTSSDTHAQLSAAITRHTAHRARINRSRNVGTRDNRQYVHFSDDTEDGLEPGDGEYTHYITKNSSSLQGRKENRVDRTGQQMLCHHCKSKYHLLSACPTASIERKIHYLAHLEIECSVDDLNREASVDTLDASKVCLVSSWDGMTTRQSPNGVKTDVEIHSILEARRVYKGSALPTMDSGFLGVCIDTGATTSVGGRIQYEEYLKSVIVPSTARTLTGSAKRFRFGATTVTSKGRAMIRIPCRYYENASSLESITFAFQMDIVELDVPLLMGLDVILACGATVDIPSLTLHTSFWTAAVELRDGHIFVPPQHGVVLFSDQELRLLHKKLSHPSASKLHAFIRRARPDDVDTTTRKTVDKISKECDICRRFGPSPRRTRSSIPSDHIQFNVKISLDIFFLDTCPVLHIICRETRFSATSFLLEKTSVCVWNSFMKIWVYAYLGPPHELLVDQGTEVTSSLFRERCREMGIHLVYAPVESHSSLGLVERMHGPIRRIYQKLKMERPSDIHKSKYLLLAAATKALNDTAGTHGLVPTLLVFGVLPNVILDVKQTKNSFPSQIKRLHLMAVARVEAETEIAAARLAEAEKHAVPSGDYLLSPGDKVLVFREKNGWQGPATFLDRIGGNTRVYLNRKRVTFPSTRVKPATTMTHADDNFVDNSDQEEEDANCSDSDASAVDEDDSQEQQLVTAQNTSLQNSPDSNTATAHAIRDVLDGNVGSSPVYVNETVHDSNDPRFADAISKEIEGLLARDVFEIVDAKLLPTGSNVMGSKLHLVIKKSETEHPTYKARLVIFGNMDARKNQILSEAPTVNQLSIRLLISVSVLKTWPLWSRDIRQAFLQSESPLSRVVYMRPPLQLRQMFDGKFLRLKKPLYGMVEAPSYWYDTYMRAYKAPPTSMTQSFLDECLLYAFRPGVATAIGETNIKDTGVELDGMAAVLVDDSLLTGCKEFSAREQTMHDRFENTTSRVDSLTSFVYAGAAIGQSTPPSVVTLRQTTYIDTLDIPDSDSWDFANVRSARGRLSWLSNVTRPDISAVVARLAQVADSATPEELKTHWNMVNNTFLFLRATRVVGLVFPVLRREVRMVCYADASFGTNADQSSQLGCLLLLVDTAQNAHVLTWFSRKSSRVTVSVLTAETLAVVAAVDVAYAARMQFANMGILVDLEVLTDSKQLYSTLEGHGSVRERRLMLDIAALRQMLRKGEITRVGFVRSEYNLADGLTKPLPLTEDTGLTALLGSGRLQYIVEEFLPREAIMDSP